MESIKSLFMHNAFLVMDLYTEFLPDEVHKLFFVFGKKEFSRLYSMIRKYTGSDEYRFIYMLKTYPEFVKKFHIIYKISHYTIGMAECALSSGFSLDGLYCETDDLETAIYLLEQRVEVDGFLKSNNLDVVNYTRQFIESNDMTCVLYSQLYSQNIDVFLRDNLDDHYTFKYALKYATNMEIVEYIKTKRLLNSHEWNKLYYNDNMEFIKFAHCRGARKFNNCLRSNNMKVFEYGVENGATDLNYALCSNNIDIIKIAVSGGANKFINCYSTDNINIIIMVRGIHKINYLELININNNINILLFAFGELKKIKFQVTKPRI